MKYPKIIKFQPTELYPIVGGHIFQSLIIGQVYKILGTKEYDRHIIVNDKKIFLSKTAIKRYFKIIEKGD